MMAGLQSQLQGMRSFVRRDLGRLPWGMAVAFVAACTVSYLVYVMNPGFTAAIMDSILGMFMDAGVMNESGGLSFVGLLLNNWMAMLFCVLYGFIPFLYLPVLVLLSNAVVLGLLGAFYTISGIPFSVFLAALLPHGIFEIPALILAAAMGAALCRNIFRILFRKHNAVPMVEFLIGLLQTMLLLIFPLILCAAAVETFITPMVVNLFL